MPFWHSEKLYELFPEKFRTKPFFVKGMGHNQIHSILRPVFVKRLKHFFSMCDSNLEDIEDHSSLMSH